MKPITKAILAAFTLLSIISCTKETVNRQPSTAQLSETIISQTNAHYIGENYGGGIIFYINAGGKHGLIAAAQDQAAYPPGAKWYNGKYTITGVTDTAIGTGCSNTQKIIKVLGRNGSYAALVCAKYNGGGYRDWFLPSKAELNELFKQRYIVGGFGDYAHSYWSSSEYDLQNAYAQGFITGDQAGVDKVFPFYVRAVRSF